MATIDTNVGPLTVIANDSGVACLLWDDVAHESNDMADKAAEELKAYFEGNLENFTVPFDFSSGTRFQQKVWKAMLDIPFGELVTYNDIAKKLGSAPRAVGGAVGANPIPVLVPCHRVVGSNGSMTGYSGKGGLETKRKLLDLEGIAV